MFSLFHAFPDINLHKKSNFLECDIMSEKDLESVAGIKIEFVRIQNQALESLKIILFLNIRESKFTQIK